MASNSETIYIKAGRNTEVKKPDITLGEVLEITCVNPSMEAKVRSLRLLKGINGRVAVSVLKVVSMIQEVYPNADVQSIGEPDFIVTYEEPGKGSRFMQSVKVVFVSVLSFFGAAFSIMALKRVSSNINAFSLSECAGRIAAVPASFPASLYLFRMDLIRTIV